MANSALETLLKGVASGSVSLEKAAELISSQKENSSAQMILIKSQVVGAFAGINQLFKSRYRSSRGIKALAFYELRLWNRIMS